MKGKEEILAAMPEIDKKLFFMLSQEAQDRIIKKAEMETKLIAEYYDALEGDL